MGKCLLYVPWTTKWTTISLKQGEQLWTQPGEFANKSPTKLKGGLITSWWGTGRGKLRRIAENLKISRIALSFAISYVPRTLKS